MIFYHRYQQTVLNFQLGGNIKRENQNNLLRAFFSSTRHKTNPTTMYCQLTSLEREIKFNLRENPH
jgi:hypothetical protein